MVATPQIGRKLASKRRHKNTIPSEAPTIPMTGAEAVAYWEREGLGGVYSDPSRFPKDSQELAQLLRQQAETRE
jgi:hypothetical protein